MDHRRKDACKDIRKGGLFWSSVKVVIRLFVIPRLLEVKFVFVNFSTAALSHFLPKEEIWNWYFSVAGRLVGWCTGWGAPHRVLFPLLLLFLADHPPTLISPRLTRPPTFATFPFSHTFSFHFCLNLLTFIIIRSSSSSNAWYSPLPNHFSSSP